MRFQIFLVRNVFLFLFSFLFSLQLIALQEINDDQLSTVTGQAFYRLEDSVSTQKINPNLTDGILSNEYQMDFTKLTLGLKFEQNINISAIRLGKFYRPDAGDARLGISNNQQDVAVLALGGGAVAEHLGRNFTYDYLNRWNCSVAKCGGLDGTTHVAGLMYNTLFSDLGVTGDKEFDTFQSGFDPEGIRSDYDVILRDVTLGYVNDNTGEIFDMIAEKPYIEMAYRTFSPGDAGHPGGTNEDVRTIQGFRFGFENQNGIMGNAIEVFSGFIKPSATINAKLNIPIFGEVSLANISVTPNISGVRTLGYIHPNSTTDYDPNAGCTGIACTALAGILGVDLSSIGGLAKTAFEGQAFPLQNIKLDNSSAFWLGLQKTPIRYPGAPAGVAEDRALGVALPGFWINMGGDDSLVVSNQRPHHPDNYFLGNPLNLRYAAGNGGVSQHNNIANGYYQ